MKEQANTQPPSDDIGTYKGEPLAVNNWFAVVDTKDNSIIFASECKGHTIDTLEEAFLPMEKDNWLKAHPESTESDIPADFLEDLEKRFIIVECHLTVPADAKIYA